MDLTFMGAALPLTKTIVYRDNAYAVSPYPHVIKLTSYQATVTSLSDFEHALLTHGTAGHCLLNGSLTKPLVDESRAGCTRKDAKKSFVVFDFDKVQAKDHTDVVARYLPSECQGVSYVVQHSASMWRPDATRWSGHIFMILKEPATEQQLKEYIEHLNFGVPALKQQISLSDSMLALHWPLDRSAAYDSKLIYIAPPRCHGFEPTFDPQTAIKLVKKKQPALKLPTFTPVAKATIDDYVNQLRVAAGAEAKSFQTRPFEDGEVLINAEPGIITGVKPMGGHYLKFNLNGGDSLGYWLDLNNPAIIKNFKGEAWLKTEEVDKDFYKQLAKSAPKIVAKPPLNPGAEVLAFYATNQNSQIKIGLYDPVANDLRLNNGTETAARAWLAEYGLVQRSPLPHIDIIFDPTSDITYVPNGTRVNTFRATSYMAQGKRKEQPSTIGEIPPTINKVMRSMLGEPSPEIYKHFLNWLAFIFQRREKSQTAWVLSGRTGTGKGSFVRYILRPLFGNDHVHNEQFTALGHQFNGFLENKLFVVFEEADTRMVPNVAELMGKLKHWITDSPISIRRMGTDHYNAANYTNFLLFSNERTSVAVSADDRRFNFAERQETPVVFTPNELTVLTSGKELEAFADVLHRWPLDIPSVSRIIETRARKDVHEATTPVNQLIAEALTRGDLQWLIDRTPSDIENMADNHNRFSLLGIYKQKLDSWIDAAQKGASTVISEEDLFAVFRTLIPDPKYFQDSRTWRKRHYKSLGLDLDKTIRVPGKWQERTRGILVNWKKPKELPPTAAANVVTLRKKK